MDPLFFSHLIKEALKGKVMVEGKTTLRHQLYCIPVVIAGYLHNKRHILQFYLEKRLFSKPSLGRYYMYWCNVHLKKIKINR